MSRCVAYCVVVCGCVYSSCVRLCVVVWVWLCTVVWLCAVVCMVVDVLLCVVVFFVCSFIILHVNSPPLVLTSCCDSLFNSLKNVGSHVKSQMENQKKNRSPVRPLERGHTQHHVVGLVENLV